MRIVTSTATFTRPSDTTQYAANDVVGPVTTPAVMTFSNLEGSLNTGGIIKSAVCISSAGQATKPDLDLLLFSSTISDIDADNAAFTPTDAQTLTLVGIIPFAVATWKAGDATSGAGGNSFCVISNLEIGYSVGILYGVLVARNTYTPVSAEVFTVKLVIAKNYN